MEAEPGTIEAQHRHGRLRELAEIFADIFASADCETRNNIRLDATSSKSMEGTTEAKVDLRHAA
jgi:hypothetical protein